MQDTPPPSHPTTNNFWRTLKDKTDPTKQYIIGKGIYRRVRFILDIEKIFWSRDFMSDFREIVEI